ncbi:hypothetical protein [Paracoccus sp. (in: a-proteobacteria)]|uniref:hypothetical protein n=1 Tax=Paracoccus sp. TaxID=267 RepID=UPI003220699F
MPARLPIALLLVLIATMPGLAPWWKATLLRHMLGQIPLLILAGVLLAPRVARPLPGQGTGQETWAAAALIVAAFCTGFWMLPRWLDAAVTDLRADAAKVATLILLGGLPLGWGWRRLGALARAFVLNQAIGMLLILGIVYLIIPDRLCNSYLLDEQGVLGRALLALAGLAGLGAAGAALFAPAPAARG